jgi:putative ABC transport system substrate-binding protein
MTELGRREFICLIGGVAGWPLAALGQQSPLPVLGLLSAQSRGPLDDLVAAMRQGLKDTGVIEGENVTIEYRWAEGDRDRLPALAMELVQRPVAVMVATDNLSALAAKRATTTIPIVFATGGEPVSLGLVTSLNRPRGNLTGIGYFAGALADTRLEFLRDLVPNASRIGVLLNPQASSFAGQRKEIQDAARQLGVKVSFVSAASDRDIDSAFATLGQQQVRALLVGASTFYSWSQRDQIVGLAARYAIPAIYPVREFVVAGGLMSYGPSLADIYHQVGVYAGKILKGARPADLPVEQSSRFEFVVNRKTAGALGLGLPPRLLALADAVIE